jgi:hypothetical protein
MSLPTLAVQPSGKVIDATGLSSGSFSVSAKTGFAIKTANNRQAMEYFIVADRLPAAPTIANQFSCARSIRHLPPSLSFILITPRNQINPSLSASERASVLSPIDPEPTAGIADI